MWYFFFPPLTLTLPPLPKKYYHWDGEWVCNLCGFAFGTLDGSFLLSPVLILLLFIGRVLDVVWYDVSVTKAKGSVTLDWGIS